MGLNSTIASGAVGSVGSASRYCQKLPVSWMSDLDNFPSKSAGKLVTTAKPASYCSFTGDSGLIGTVTHLVL
jgi:hypothetical protein